MKVQIEGMWALGYRQAVFDVLTALGHQHVASKPDVILVMGDQKNLCHTHLLRNQRKRVVVLFPERGGNASRLFGGMGAELVTAPAAELRTVLESLLE